MSNKYNISLEDLQEYNANKNRTKYVRKEDKYQKYFTLLENSNNDITNSNKDKCKYCNGNLIYCYDSYNKICELCGLINDNFNDNNSNNIDINFFNPLMPSYSLSTIIKGSGFNNIKRLQNWNSFDSSELRLNKDFNNIDNILSNEKYIKNNVKQIIKKVFYLLTDKEEDIKGSLTRGKIRQSLLAACIYYSCKYNNCFISKNKVCELCDIELKDLTIGLLKFDKLEKDKNLNLFNNNNCINNLIKKYGILFNFDEYTINILITIYNRIKKLNILRKNTDITIISGLIYFISDIYNLNISKTDISTKIKISQASINKPLNELNIYKNILLIGF